MYHILYVDDEPHLLEIGKLFLEQNGDFIVDTITSAPEALALLETQSYDAIISDYQMPGPDGIEFLKTIRSFGRTLPFILFTGRGREEVVIQALNEGADFYLQKGGEPQSQFAELSNKVRYAVMRRRAELSLKQNEAQLRQIIDLVPHLIFVKDIDGNYLLANEAVARRYKTPVADLVGKSQAQFHADAAELRRFLDDDREVITTGKTKFIAEESSLDASGNRRIIQTTKVPFITIGNNQQAVLGIGIDITEQKKAEKALRESQEKYRRIVETTDEGIFQLDEASCIVYVNRKMAEMHGCTPEEMMGKNISCFMAAEDIPGNASRMQERRQNKSGRYERRFVAKDGSTGWIQVSATPITDSGGRFAGAFAMCSDITEQKDAETKSAIRNEELHAAYEQVTAAEEELRQNYDELAKSKALLVESEQRYRNVVEDQTELISRFLPNGTHVFVNDAYCRYFGLKREEIAGHRFRPKIPSEDRERVNQFFASLTPDHPVESVEHRIIMPDGEIRWQAWSDRAIFDDAGRVIEYQSVGRDITEAKATQAALEQSEIRFREQYQNNPLAIFTWQHRDGDFILVDCNRAAVALSDGRAKGFIGMNVMETYASRPELLTEIRECFTEKTVRSRELVSEYFLPGKHILATTAFVPPDLVIVHIKDITEQKLAVAALQESKEQLACAIEGSGVGLWDWYVQTGKVMFNERWAEIIGYTLADLGPLSINSWIKRCHPDDLQKSGRELKKHFLKKSPGYECEARVRHRDGHWVWVLDRGKVIEWDDKGLPVRMTGTHLDITERKKAEEALMESRQKLAEAMDLASLVTWECDLVSGTLTFDCRYSSIYGPGTERGEIRNMSAETYLREVVHPEDLHDLIEEDEKTRTTTDPHYSSKREYRIIREDGKIRYIEMCVGVTKNAEGRTIKTHGVNHDITERKEAEMALRRVNHQLTLLSTVTRHDINNKLTGILGYLELAKEASGDPEVGGYLEKIEFSASEIRSLVDFSRIYHNIGTNEPQWIALEPVIPRSAVPEGVTLTAAVEGVEVFADPMLEKIFSNLLDNSLRHGNHVTNIRVACQRSGDDLVVAWEDNGTGVAAGEKERIFERGFGKNTGFGMYLIREILSLTGISIRETGVPGKGARFEMLVPKRQYRLQTNAE